MLVYRCTNSLNGKVYIGKTSYSVETRWGWHLPAARKGIPLLPHRAIRKYGPGAFTVEMLATASSEVGLNNLEASAIKKHAFLASVGYNLQEGGVKSVQHSDEKGRVKSEEPNNNWYASRWGGKTLSNGDTP